MIDTIDLLNYRSAAECTCFWQYSRDGFMMIKYRFQKGQTYGIVSDFGCGSWGLVYCVGGRGNKGDTNGKILMNDSEISPEKLSEYSAFIAEKVIPGVNSAEDLMSAKECIQKALNISGQNYTVQEIKSIFQLSDERFERSLDFVSGEIWYISAAIQFALGKDIFCFPWLNMRHIKTYIEMFELGIIDFLKSKGKIILVPTSQKKIVKKYCDHVVSFEETGLFKKRPVWKCY